MLAWMLVVSGGAWGAGKADRLLPRAVYPQLVGTSYSRARLALIAAGDTPVPVRQPAICPYDTTFCSRHELDACAVDIPSCILTWKGNDGRFLHVQVDMTSSGSDPRVSSISEDVRA